MTKALRMFLIMLIVLQFLVRVVELRSHVEEEGAIWILIFVFWLKFFLTSWFLVSRSKTEPALRIAFSLINTGRETGKDVSGVFYPGAVQEVGHPSQGLLVATILCLSLTLGDEKSYTP